MTRLAPPAGSSRLLLGIFLGQAVVWTAFVGILLYLHLAANHEMFDTLARSEARAAITRDRMYRLWAAGHGGVYVPVTPTTPPNPNLAHVPERDLLTPSGRQLTLVNPAYMTRQVHELSRERYRLRGHLTSLEPIRAENRPDAWERRALRRAARTGWEVSGRSEIAGESHLRVLQPLYLEPACLKCHGGAGSRLGDLRGGLVVSVPLAGYERLEARHDRRELLNHGGLWLLGLLGLGLAFGSLRRRDQSRRSALAASEEHFRNLHEHAPVAFQSLDGEGRILEVNSAWVELLGYPADEVLGQPIARYLDPSQLPLLAERFAQLKRDGRISGVEYRFRHRDGPEVVVSVEGRTVTDAGGEFVRTHCVLHNVTEQRVAEAKVKEQAALLDVSQDAIALLDGAGRITYTNASFTRVFGWTGASVVGRTVSECLGEPGPESPVSSRVKQVLEQGAWSGELHARTPEGQAVMVDSRWWVVRDGGDEPRAILAVFTDVTQRKTLEAQVLRSQRLESLGVLAGGVAHDLNNVLTPILMSVSALREVVEGTEGAELVTTLERSAAHGASVVRQILMFARGTAGERGPLQPAHLVRLVEQLLRETFPRSIRVEVELGPGAWTVRGDGTQLQQLLMNLCINARDAMPDGGTLGLRCENLRLDAGVSAALPLLPPGDYVCLSVRDTGTGIPEAILNRIFDPFYTTKAAGRGTGLGLSTALGIARGHGGGIVVESRPGEGSCFSVYLPAVVEAGPVSEPTESGPVPRGNGEVILVVDDEPFIVRMVHTGLTRFGYEVLGAADGRAGLEVFREHRDRIALVLTDYSMPEMDGPTLVARLRELAPALPIVLVSGLGETLPAEQVSALQVSALLVKPFTVQKLLTIISEQLGEARERESER